MGHHYHSLSVDATIMVSKKLPTHGKHVGIIFVTLKVTIATLWPAKTPLISALSVYISKTAQWNFFLLQNFNKPDKMQLLAKFKQILYMGFRTTLNFWKFKVALNPMYRIFLNSVKSCISSCLQYRSKVSYHPLARQESRLERRDSRP